MKVHIRISRGFRAGIPHAIFFGVVTAIAMFAQSPITDTIVVNFANPVKVNGTELSAGEYTIRQLPSASSPRLLEFTSDNGTKLEVVASAIPTIDNRTARKTRVLLERRGDNFELDKIWIEGKDHGYSFTTSNGEPGVVSGGGASNNASNVIVTGRYTPEQQTAATTPSPSVAAQERPAEPAPAPTPSPAPAPAPPQSRETVETPKSPSPAPSEPQTTPQNSTPPPSTDVAQADTRTPANQAAPAERTPQPEAMPQTASNFGNIALAGIFLLATGALLRLRA